MKMDELYTLNPGFNRWATDPQGPHRILVPVDREQSFRGKLAGLSPAERMNWQDHVIKKGETLAGIAARHRSSVTALKQINRLRSNTIHQGNTLRVPVPKQALKHYTLSVDGRRMHGLKDTGDGRKFVYTIKRGDTLWDIGRKYGVTVKQLTGWNGISARRLLRPGQKLNLWFADEGKQAVAGTGAPPQQGSIPLHRETGRFAVENSQKIQRNIKTVAGLEQPAQKRYHLPQPENNGLPQRPFSRHLTALCSRFTFPQILRKIGS